MEAKKEESWKAKLPTKSKEYRNGGTLRDYQIEGLAWLLRCWYTKRSSILADEMGLGACWTVDIFRFVWCLKCVFCIMCTVRGAEVSYVCRIACV
jgi:hypothetical protein